ncbi:DUF4315 family protein [Ruminococcaceae bacterium OttesenSCG-928-A11]|nr:DUF4315 family protein [Ruminococcaceae bacterium OttesenSCG-928-A11]
MNPKIDRLAREIDKMHEKISEMQARLREMEKQKTEMENSEIVAMFRSINITPQELAGFIKLYREQGGALAAPGARQPAPTNPKEDNDIEE